MDSKLSFVPHIDNIITAANKILGFIMRTCKKFNKINTFLLLYKSLVRSKLEYCCPVWNPTYNIHSNRIEKIQRRFTKYLAYRDSSLSYRSPYEYRLNHFKLHNMHDRRTYLELNFLRKIIIGKNESSDILSELTFNIPRNNTRPARIKLFKTPQIRTNVGKFAPLHRMLDAYNNLHRCLDLDMCFDTEHTYRNKILKPYPKQKQQT